MSAERPWPQRVAVAIVRDAKGRVLISKRPDHKAQGGHWEFPGGKVEPGESAEEALARELQEEVGLTPLASRLLIQKTHAYPDKTVLLEVFEVAHFTGTAKGLEGQIVQWAFLEDLGQYAFLEANHSLIEQFLLKGALASRIP